MTFRQAALTLGLGIGAILLIAGQQARGQAQASGNCGERTRIVAALAERYGEARRLIALTNARQVIELFASSETGTWTLLITFPSGQSCLIGAGDMIEFTGASGPDGDPA